ncbi:NAD(P)H-flavin reductase [Aestuariibacter sp. AA17]|uniref:NAD(P)H-flavin reductase n=1 Tax=Fluctibacter corallii TaxID=2984329 RepID=A0ABT3ACM8_9ALTE|nr:NAD(P)H-flavin reductase [Aestuariibacter sp. AA17]MCV2886425.1 NAD(P)H-flavin reductase [Aestuariibacter sp. AA17]
MQAYAQTECQVTRIEPLTDVVHKVTLLPASPLPFKAGQYIRVVMGEEDKRPFSLATAPSDNVDTLELHIGAGPANSYATEVLDKMLADGRVDVDGGHGKAYLRENLPRPTILMAGGTGFSYTYSLLKEMLAGDVSEPLFLYWGTRTLQDMYKYDELNALAESNKHFRFVPVLEEPPEAWSGKTGWVHKAVLEDFVSLEPYYVYLAGRFEMAGVAREEFHQKGLILEHLFGDAYEFI